MDFNVLDIGAFYDINDNNKEPNVILAYMDDTDAVPVDSEKFVALYEGILNITMGRKYKIFYWRFFHLQIRLYFIKTIFDTVDMKKFLNIEFITYHLFMIELLAAPNGLLCRYHPIGADGLFEEYSNTRWAVELSNIIKDMNKIKIISGRIYPRSGILLQIIT